MKCFTLEPLNEKLNWACVMLREKAIIFPFISQFLFERVEGISRATIIDLDAHQVSRYHYLCLCQCASLLGSWHSWQDNPPTPFFTTTNQWGSLCSTSKKLSVYQPCIILKYHWVVVMSDTRMFGLVENVCVWNILLLSRILKTLLFSAFIENHLKPFQKRCPKEAAVPPFL